MGLQLCNNSHDRQAAEDEPFQNLTPDKKRNGLDARLQGVFYGIQNALRTF